MNEQIRQKLQKVYALVDRGATDGERQAARTQLEKLMKRYNLSEDDLDSLDKEHCYFTYTSNNEVILLVQIAKVVVGLDIPWTRYTDVKRMCAHMTYLDNVTIRCAYEYFRRHMKAEWKKSCAALVKRCRSNKTRNERRRLLQATFISTYLIQSKLYQPDELTTVDTSQLSAKERDARAVVRGVQGGQYNRQVSNGLYLEG